MTQPAAPTTIVKNRLLHPDGSPMRGVQVQLIVRASNTWVADGRGRVIGSVQTWVNSNGCWRTPLLPYTSYNDEFVYVEVIEGGRTTGYIRVPPKPEGEEIWVGEHLINPPPPPSGPWRPISELGDLTDVDRGSIAEAPEGAVLVKRGGRWVAALPEFGSDKLATLTDVDGSSLPHANDGDPLTWLADKSKWGVQFQRQEIVIEFGAADPSDPMTITAIISADDQFTVFVVWENGADPVPVTPNELVSHTYTEPGVKTVSAYYEGDPDSMRQNTITVPQEAR